MNHNAIKFMQNKTLTYKIILGIVAFIVLFIIVFSIWLFRPITEVSACNLLPSSAFSFFFINLNQTSPGISDIMGRVKNEIINEEMSFAKRTLIKLGFPIISPKNLVGILTLEKESDEPELIFIISMGKIVRLLKIFGGPFDRIIFLGAPSEKQRVDRHSFKSLTVAPEKRGPTAYTIIGNNIIIGTSFSPVRDSYRSYKEGSAEDPACRYLAELLRQASIQRDGLLFVDNNKGELSRIFQLVEEKYAFAAFPAIDAVATIKGELRLLPDKVDAQVTFFCRDSTRLSEVKSDVKFIYGALRRKLRASDIDLKGNVQIEGNTVRFDFQIPDFIDAIFTSFTSRQGDT